MLFELIYKASRYILLRNQNFEHLVIDSRLIATELVVNHKSFLETIRKHQNEIEAAFGQLQFQTASVKNNVGVVNNVTFAYLNEDQATFAMTLSRNTPQVVQAKLKSLYWILEVRGERHLTQTPRMPALESIHTKESSYNGIELTSFF